MHRALPVLPIAFILSVLGHAPPARAAESPESPESPESSAWQRAMPLDGLYERIAEDLKAGRPLVVAVHCGMWFTREAEPERNLNWGTRYGHWRMFERVHRRRAPHVRKVYRHAAWRRVFEGEHEPPYGGGPQRLVVYHQRVRPNARWRALGVEEPFDLYVALFSWAEREAAALAAVRSLRQDEGLTVVVQRGEGESGTVLDRTVLDRTVLDLGAAQAVGYMGHNPFYDFADFDWSGLRDVPGAPKRPKGFFAVGCNTARVPGFPAIVGPNVHVLLMSRSLMAVGGYITLALTDSLARAHESAEMVRHADATYRYFHKLDDPEDRVGKPFVGHDFRMYPIPER